jgi:RimJ/RimL family protein N-acetyltransferase
MRIETERFLLRYLKPASDDFSSYLSWMRDTESSPFIRATSATMTMAELKEYVIEKNRLYNSRLLGIFEKSRMQHIGNVKLEPIIPEQYAVLGILIGDHSWRRQGVGYEILAQLSYFSFTEMNLKELRLGVDVENLAAQALYLKLGFQFVKEESNTGTLLKMVLKNNRPKYL